MLQVYKDPQWLVDLRKQHDDLLNAKLAGKKSKEWNDEAEYLRAKIKELGAEPCA